MKILIGTFEIGRHMHDLAEGFRALGHHADTLAVGRNPQHPDLKYTFELPESFVQQTLTHLEKHSLDALLRKGDELAVVKHLLSAYDLYVFQFGASLLPGNADYPLLKQLGKRIVSVFLGSDVRHWSGAEPVGAAYGMEAPSMLREEPYAHLDTRLSNLRMAERYADAIFSLPFQSELAIRPYWHVQLPLDLTNYRTNIPSHETPRVVHAPTRRNFKGTPAVLAALEQLRSDGEAFELVLLENRPNQEVLQALRDADLVVDQLHAPHYGMLGLEAMASGCAVIGGNNPRYVPLMKESPVVHASAGDVSEHLRSLLRDAGRRRELAVKGRSYVESRHAHTAVAATMLEKLELRSAYEYYPTFYATAYERPDAEEIHPRLLKLTTEIAERHGLPREADAQQLVNTARMAPIEAPIPRWRPLVTNAIPEVWGWSPLHTNDSPGEIDHGAMVIEATIEIRSRLESGRDDDARTHFHRCLEALDSDAALPGDAEVVSALALTAVALGLASEGLELIEFSESQRRAAIPASVRAHVEAHQHREAA